MFYMGFGQINQRPDYCYSGSAHMRNRMKCSEPAFIQETHKQRLNDVLTVMPECQFIASYFPAFIREYGATHF